MYRTDEETFFSGYAEYFECRGLRSNLGDRIETRPQTLMAVDRRFGFFRGPIIELEQPDRTGPAS
jgi:hypothetical protein